MTARAAFAEAIKADPNMTLEKDLDHARHRAGLPGREEAEAPRRPLTEAGRSAGRRRRHDPHARRPSRRSSLRCRLYAELPDGITAVKVIARYKPFGATDWKTIELRRLGNGYGGEVPASTSAARPATLSYYVQATDANGDVVATQRLAQRPRQGRHQERDSRASPLTCRENPHPSQCRDASDCPPGLPGCAAAKKSGGKGWGASCDNDSECATGLACKNGTCETGEKSVRPRPATGKSCETSIGLRRGQTCSADKVCEGGGGPPRSFG